MMVCGVLTLILSWASLGADLATAVGTSDFCVAPDRYLMSQTKGIISADILHYYVYCNQTLSNPFQKSLTVFQRSLTTMQIQIQGLLQFAVPLLMNQAALFGGNPRYENVPLIGRGSPPPSVRWVPEAKSFL
ncbi:hypothetical protein CRUP_018332 [Coryphaenoides rupestris]|nr:hypothetical protein CRUP_018332 [Coryphaenoides rupestris]